MDAGVAEAVLPQLLVVGARLGSVLAGQQVVLQEIVVRLVRTVGHAHGVGAAADAGDLHAREAPAAGLFQLGQASSLASTTAAAPSDITQMSSRVRGQATIGASRTSAMVSRSRFWP